MDDEKEIPEHAEPACFGEWFTRGGLASATCPHARMCDHRYQCERHAKIAKEQAHG